jgi:hypothetical protein
MTSISRFVGGLCSRIVVHNLLLVSGVSWDNSICQLSVFIQDHTAALKQRTAF